MHRLQNRCVRACEEVQGTFALTIQKAAGSTAASRRAARATISCRPIASAAGPAVQACPTATLQEKSVIELGTPTPLGHHHLRLLRRRLLVQGRAERG